MIRNVWTSLQLTVTLKQRSTIALCAIGALFLLLSKLAAVGAPLALGRAVNELAGDEVLAALHLWILVYVSALICSQVFTALNNVAWFAVNERITRDALYNALTVVVTRHMIDRVSSGAVYEAISRGSQSITSICESLLFRIAPQILVLSLILLTLAMNYGVLIPIFTAVGTILYTAWILFMYRAVDIAVARSAKTEDGKTESIIDMIANRKLFSLHNSATNILQHTKARVFDHYFASVQLIRSQSIWHTGNSIIISIFTGGALLIFVQSPEMTNDIGGLVVVAFLVSMAFAPMSELSSGIQSIIAERANLARLHQLLEQPGNPVYPPIDDWVAIRLEHFSAHTPDGTPLYEPINETIYKGQKVVLTGVSGAGKSTTLDALMGRANFSGKLYVERTGGIITQLDSLACLAVLVPQEDLLLNISFLDNITLMNDNGRNFDVRSYSIGFDTVLEDRIMAGNTVGERGREISGGERRRVSLLRGIFNSTDVLLMDEPLAGLDNGSRDQVLEYVLARNDLTVICACHDVDVLARFDKNIAIVPCKSTDGIAYYSL